MAERREGGTEVDVLVCGGGPAGAALAIVLARTRHSVLLLERSRYEWPRIGEHLTPDAQPVLESLGVWERFCTGPHQPCRGVRAKWGGEVIRELDYLFSPYGQGWSLDRAAFDAMLAAVAAEAGSEVLTDTRLASVEERSGRWHAQFAGGTRDRHRVVARFLIDATGRAAALARRLGSRRIEHDNLVGLCAWLPQAVAPLHHDSRLVVEAIEAGWWYATRLPEARSIAVFLSDRDLIPPGTKGGVDAWSTWLAHTGYIRELVEGCGPPIAFRVRAANTYIVEPLVGRNWLAIGDAASAFDPLSSMGILKALSNGVAAAKVIARHLKDDKDAIAAYVQDVKSEFDRYLRERQTFYARERRWPKSPFWHRRNLQSALTGFRHPAAGLEPGAFA